MENKTLTYADKPWLKHYDKGVPHTINYPQVPLHQFLHDTAKRVPNAIALVSSAKLPVLGRVAAEMNYAQLEAASDALAAAFVDMGLKKGDRVAIVMPNCAAFVITFFAILKAGGVVAATNPTYPAQAMAYQINDCDAEFVVALSLYYNLVKEIQPKTKVKHVIVTNIKEYLPASAKLLFTLAREKKEGHRVEALKGGDFWFQDLLAKYAGRKPNVQVGPSDLAIFQYTGGTTGVSKAAMSRHSALVANMLQLNAWMEPFGVPGEKEIFLGAIPMFHVYGLVVVASLAVYKGSRVILVPNARDIDEVISVIDHFKPTLFPGVPALYNAINNHPKVKAGEVSLRSLRYCISGSAPLPNAVKDEFERISGTVLREGFGMSEAPTATHTSPVKGEWRNNSIGIPLPDMEMRIVSLDDGETEVPVGEIGELCMYGPNIMVGYHGMPTETDNVLREHNGKKWLYTGDIARMDEDGFFYIVDRKKDMALIGGYNVYPANVENVIKSHPAVLEVGVAAVPHPEKEGQEALKAWIVLKPGMTATAEEIIAHCEQSLAPYSVPRRIAFINELPKTAVGKTLRRELVKMEMEKR
ncbi:MAG: AMP-binding protein [Anaerolineae bacterium]|nr:AMP-binding protein [Anaerolineae bacterium]MDW8173232.1 AMP-binding protein [Anaerolineae bacterium]